MNLRVFLNKDGCLMEKINLNECNDNVPLPENADESLEVAYQSYCSFTDGFRNEEI